MVTAAKVDISELLTAIEDGPPAEAMTIAARSLRESLGVRSATFLIADAAGRTLVDLESLDGRFQLDGTEPGLAWREQRTVHGGDGWV